MQDGAVRNSQGTDVTLEAWLLVGHRKRGVKDIEDPLSLSNQIPSTQNVQ